MQSMVPLFNFAKFRITLTDLFLLCNHNKPSIIGMITTGREGQQLISRLNFNISII